MISFILLVRLSLRILPYSSFILMLTVLSLFPSFSSPSFPFSSFTISEKLYPSILHLATLLILISSLTPLSCTKIIFLSFKQIFIAQSVEQQLDIQRESTSQFLMNLNRSSDLPLWESLGMRAETASMYSCLDFQSLVWIRGIMFQREVWGQTTFIMAEFQCWRWRGIVSLPRNRSKQHWAQTSQIPSMSLGWSQKSYLNFIMMMNTGGFCPVSSYQVKAVSHSVRRSHTLLFSSMGFSFMSMFSQLINSMKVKISLMNLSGLIPAFKHTLSLISLKVSKLSTKITSCWPTERKMDTDICLRDIKAMIWYFAGKLVIYCLPLDSYSLRSLGKVWVMYSLIFRGISWFSSLSRQQLNPAKRWSFEMTSQQRRMVVSWYILITEYSLV